MPRPSVSASRPSLLPRSTGPLAALTLPLAAMALLILAPQTRAQTPIPPPPDPSTQQSPTAPPPADPDEPPPPPTDKSYVLHVYTDLVQLPTLILSPNLQPLKPIDPREFRLSLDAGPIFHPSHIRLQGDDPITLAILLDLSGSQNDLLQSLSKAIPAWVTNSLRPSDHVSVFALDCALIRSADDIPSNPQILQLAIDNAIASSIVHGKKPHSTCANSLRLWNSLGVITRHISELPGRRVILALTDGDDRANSVNWNDIRFAAESRSITIFGLRLSPSPYFAAHTRFSIPSFSPEDPFSDLCQLTGGLILTTTPAGLRDDLRSIVTMLRGRYILEFPRPANGTAGRHDIGVTLAHIPAFIRPAGVSVPLPDPSIATDPNTVPSDHSRNPIQGPRHPLTPPPNPNPTPKP